MEKMGGTRLLYWQGAFFVASGGTFMVLYILGWFDALTFL